MSLVVPLLFGAAQGFAPPAVETVTPAAVEPAMYGERLIETFNRICLRNRGSWEFMKKATEDPSSGFKRVRGKGRQQADYLAFPLSVSLKRAGQSYLCLVESLVDLSASSEVFSRRLVSDGFGLSAVVFEPSRVGVSAKLPDTGRNTGAGRFYTEVHVRLSKSPIKDMQIAQLIVTN